MQQPVRILSESEAAPNSFHDCHIQGLHWKQWTFSIDLNYILEWILPKDDSSGYRFLISAARLVFRDVDELSVSMDWAGTPLDSEIDALRILNSRTTPNGRTERHYEIEFSDPQGVISLWSTGYEVALLHEPVNSEMTTIATSDETQP